jgi:hypothetical protein
MAIVIAVLILIIVVGVFLLTGRGILRRDDSGRDDRPLGDTPDAHDELNPHDVPKWDRATRGAAEEQSGGLEGTTGGNREGEAGGAPMPSGGTAERGG